MPGLISRALIGSTFTSLALAAAIPIPDLVEEAALWQPAVGSSFQIVITNVVNPSALLTPNVDIFDIDLFDTDASVIQTLKAEGKKIICYFSAGTSEDWRPDWDQFQEKDKGACLPQWKGERWLNVRSADVWNVMAKRIKLASDKGCDAIDPDNMDGYSNENGGGLGLTTSDAIAYTQRLASEAAKYGMSTGLKNAQEILGSVSSVVQFAVNEECAASSEDCAVYTGFDKPVYHIEYANSHSVSSSERDRLCLASNPGAAQGFTTVIKMLSLDGWVMYCDGSSATTATIDAPPDKGSRDVC